MFAINDKIVYPMYGAGVIEKIEERKILGETRRYYILKTPTGDMNVMIPVEQSSSIGIRHIISSKDVDLVMQKLAEPSSQMSGNWNRRYRENLEKLKTGDVFLVAEVVRNLTRMDRVKKLSAGEKKLLTTARQILVSEIALVTEEEADDVTGKVNSIV